jgi:hypothetical protein
LNDHGRLIVKSIRFVVCGVLLTISHSYLCAQQSEGGLATLYENIISDYANGTAPPKLVDVTNYLDKVPDMGVGEIKSALPWIQRAVESPRLEVKSYGQLGLFAINQRPDSASLIGYLVPIVAEDLENQDKHASRGAVLVLSGMRPKPPEAAISHLMSGLQSEEKLQSDPKWGAGIVYALVQVDPNRNDIARAVDAYMKSKMKTDSQRVDTLNALATKPVQDSRLIADIAENLTAGSEDVRISAIHALVRSGTPGIEAARPQLERMAGAGEPSDRVRAAAKQAIESASENK